MFDTFLFAMRLKLTYRVNSIIYNIKSLPLIGKLFSMDLYNIRWLKGIAYVLAILWEITTFFIGKIFYFFLFYLIYFALVEEEFGLNLDGATLLHIFLFLSILGGFTNNQLMNAGVNDYYAVILMRVDAKKYVLSQYFYFLLKSFLGFFVVLSIISTLFPSILPSQLVPIMALLPASCKVSFAAWDLSHRNRTNQNINLKNNWWMWGITIILIVLAYIPPLYGSYIKPSAIYLVTSITLILSIPSMKRIWKNTTYHKIMKSVLFENQVLTQTEGVNTANQTAAEGYQKKLQLEIGDVKAESASEYLNEVFFRRHKKLFYKPAVRTTVILAIVMIALLLLCFIDEDVRFNINTMLLNRPCVFLILMYFINRGKNAIDIFFFNCDHSLLKYRFYKQPKLLLDLFRKRCMTITKLNLLPSSILMVCTPLLLWASGGTNQFTNYLFLPIMILALTGFFSVHYLVLYYLFQPYTEGLEGKNYVYIIVSSVTYYLCYHFAYTDISLPLFASIAIVLSIVYLIVASILVYKLAPTRFRIHNG